MLDLFGNVIEERRPASRKPPVRLMQRGRVKRDLEDSTDRFVRACPVCGRILLWTTFDKLLRIDDPRQAAGPRDVQWIAEWQEWGVPRYGEYSAPACPVHGDCDNWHILDQHTGMVVGWSNVDQGGRLFKFPQRLTKRLHERLLTGRPAPFGRPSRSKKVGNKSRRRLVAHHVEKLLACMTGPMEGAR